MLQAYKYGLLSAVRNKSQLFWSLLFPLILGTLFNLAFSSIIKTTESFSEIPVAVVEAGNSETSEYFTDIVNELSAGEGAMLSPVYTDPEEAEELLAKGDIEGIFHVGDDIRLIVSDEGINQSILKIISDSYLQISATVSNIAQTRPDMVEEVIAGIYDDLEVNEEITLGNETNTMLQYYYALIAMTCLFGCFFGFYKVLAIKADMSALAARRSVSPTKKLSMILSDFFAAVTIQFLQTLIVIAYLVFILGINFGDQWEFVILTSFVGCISGVSYGTFIGSVVKTNENTSMGILTVSSLFLCFLSGLMMQNMKYIVEQYAPVINLINPAALLSDAFYCLTVYDNYSRYTRNMVSLLIISAIFCIVSGFVLRRKRYASI